MTTYNIAGLIAFSPIDEERQSIEFIGSRTFCQHTNNCILYVHSEKRPLYLAASVCQATVPVLQYPSSSKISLNITHLLETGDIPSYLVYS